MSLVRPMRRPVAIRMATAISAFSRRGPAYGLGDGGPPTALATEARLLLATEAGALLIPEPTEEIPT